MLRRTEPVRLKRANELAESLRGFTPGVPSVLASLMPELRKLFDAERSFAYGLGWEGGAPRFDFMLLHGVASEGPFVADFEETMRASPLGWATYNPLRPEPAQRNVARIVKGRENRKPAFARILARYPFFGRDDQLRTLVCDGAALVAWVGVMRSEPFARHERELLGRVVPRLHERLLLERKLGTSQLAAAALDAALEQLGGAAVIVKHRGVIVYANAAAQAAMERDRTGFAERVRAAVAGKGGADLSTTPLGGPGRGRHTLIIEREPPADPRARAAHFAQRWALTERQSEILAEVARGQSNKTIAALLGCAENTVEFHVTTLLRKAECESRAQLVARFWSQM
jgi:DNA-binding CsgD family transcriptional regulator